MFGSDDDPSGYVGQMVTHPTKTHPEAEFLMYHNGEKTWNKFLKTIKKASASELKLEARIYYFTNNNQEGVYFPSQEKSETRTGAWYRGPVTDNSLVSTRGIVIVGGSKVDVSNTYGEKK